MQKEMHEQPYVIKETLRAHIENNLAMPELDGLDVSNVNQIYFVACGTAYHASYMHNIYFVLGLSFQFTA